MLELKLRMRELGSLRSLSLFLKMIPDSNKLLPLAALSRVGSTMIGEVPPEARPHRPVTLTRKARLAARWMSPHSVSNALTVHDRSVS